MNAMCNVDLYANNKEFLWGRKPNFMVLPRSLKD